MVIQLINMTLGNNISEKAQQKPVTIDGNWKGVTGLRKIKTGNVDNPVAVSGRQKLRQKIIEKVNDKVNTNKADIDKNRWYWSILNKQNITKNAGYIIGNNKTDIAKTSDISTTLIQNY